MAAKLLIIAIVAAVLSAVATSALAFRGSEPHCVDVAQVASSVADTRDAGLTWNEFGPFILAKLDSALANPNSYVATQADVDFLMTLFKRIYDEQIGSERVVEWAYATCMAKPGPATNKRGVQS